MASELVKKWFGNRYEELHPLLQQLHCEGGQLSGDIDVCYGQGLAGWIGKRLAKKMGIADAGLHQLKVIISHDDHCLYWQRCFGDGSLFTSCFRPLGTFNDGYWMESSGSMSLFLAVEVKQKAAGTGTARK